MKKIPEASNDETGKRAKALRAQLDEKKKKTGARKKTLAAAKSEPASETLDTILERIREEARQDTSEQVD